MVVYCVTVVILALFQRRSEADALNLENKVAELRTLLDTIPDLIWLKSADGRYQVCNRRVEDLFGMDERSIVGKKDPDFVSPELDSEPVGGSEPNDLVNLIHPEDQGRVVGEFQRAVLECGAYRVESRMRKADGSWPNFNRLRKWKVSANWPPGWPMT